MSENEMNANASNLGEETFQALVNASSWIYRKPPSAFLVIRRTVTKIFGDTSTTIPIFKVEFEDRIKKQLLRLFKKMSCIYYYDNVSEKPVIKTACVVMTQQNSGETWRTIAQDDERYETEMVDQVIDLDSVLQDCILQMAEATLSHDFHSVSLRDFCEFKVYARTIRYLLSIFQSESTGEKFKEMWILNARENKRLFFGNRQNAYLDNFVDCG